MPPEAQLGAGPESAPELVVGASVPEAGPESLAIGASSPLDESLEASAGYLVLPSYVSFPASLLSLASATSAVAAPSLAEELSAETLEPPSRRAPFGRSVRPPHANAKTAARRHGQERYVDISRRIRGGDSHTRDRIVLRLTWPSGQEYRSRIAIAAIAGLSLAMLKASARQPYTSFDAAFHISTASSQESSTRWPPLTIRFPRKPAMRDNHCGKRCSVRYLCWRWRSQSQAVVDVWATLAKARALRTAAASAPVPRAAEGAAVRGRRVLGPERPAIQVRRVAARRSGRMYRSNA